jgi:hypothetical protein
MLLPSEKVNQALYTPYDTAIATLGWSATGVLGRCMYNGLFWKPPLHSTFFFILKIYIDPLGHTVWALGFGTVGYLLQGYKARQVSLLEQQRDQLVARRMARLEKASSE